MKTKDVAYIVMRRGAGTTPVAIHMYLEDADDMVAKYNQEMKDRGIETINFYVIATAFYD